MAVLRNVVAVLAAVLIGWLAVPVSLAVVMGNTPEADSEGPGPAIGALIFSSFVGIQAFAAALVSLLLVANRRSDAGVIVAILASFALVGEHLWLLSG